MRVGPVRGEESSFYLGTDEPSWLLRTDVPLFISRRRFQRIKTFPVASGRWALDSGGFTELHKYGQWTLSATDYVGLVRRYADEIGNLDWVAPQDWMCEPSALGASGRTVAEHQRLTTNNFLELRGQLGSLVIPVLQGWELDDYRRHVEQYEQAGVDLFSEDRVGLGSVCRRNADGEISQIVAEFFPMRLHGFGMKGDSYVRNEDRLASADSMAWSFTARHSAPLPGHPHRTCNHCLEYALRWRERLVRQASVPRLFSAA